MRERHPIDELFRQGLKHAEATPPPAVWEGVMRERGWSHRTLLFLQRRWGLALLGLLLLGGASAWVLHNETSLAMGEPMPAHQPVVVETLASSNEGVPSVANNTSVADLSATSSSFSQEAAATKPHEGSSAGARPTNTTPAHQNTSRRVAPERGASPASVKTGGGVGLPHSALLVDDLARVPSRTDDLVTANNTDPFTPQFMLATTPQLAMQQQDVRLNVADETLPDYVLPKGDLWFGIEYGTYRMDRTWRSKDEELATELNAAEQGRGANTFGVVGGYQWRSGFGLSSGILMDTRRSGFDHTTGSDSLVSIEVTTLVVFDTTVIGSYTSSVPVNVGDEQTYSGDCHYRLLSIPLEASYRRSLGRWSLGARSGVAANFYLSESGYTLSRSTTEEVAATTLGSVPSSRFGATLSVSLGLDIGFLLTEHWSVWAVPTYSQDVASFNGAGSTSPYDQRLGARFRLAYTLSSRR